MRSVSEQRTLRKKKWLPKRVTAPKLDFVSDKNNRFPIVEATCRPWTNTSLIKLQRRVFVSNFTWNKRPNGVTKTNLIFRLYKSISACHLTIVDWLISIHDGCVSEGECTKLGTDSSETKWLAVLNAKGTASDQQSKWRQQISWAIITITAVVVAVCVGVAIAELRIVHTDAPL